MKKNTRGRMSREDRRTQILEAALDVFTENGYNKATTKGIANAAEISEVTLFRHFESKKEIFKEAIEPILISTLEKTIVDAQDLDPMENLRYIFIERLKIVNKYKKVIKLILMESEINPEISSINFIKKTTKMLKQSIKKSGLNNGEDEFILRLLMGSILSFLYLPETNEEKIEKFADGLIDLILNKRNL